MPNPTIIAMLLGSVALQVTGISFMSLSKGFTVPQWSLLSVLGFAAGIWLMGRVSASGVGVSTIIPVVSALIPLVSIVVGMTLLHETASITKIILLVSAAGLAGYASSLA